MKFLPLLWLALAGGCHGPAAAVDGRLTARLWSHRGDSRATFILLAPNGAADEMSRTASACGYTVRTATADDFRQSWPILRSHEEQVRPGHVRLVWDGWSVAHPALVQLWVELEAQRDHGVRLGPATSSWLASAF